MYVQAVCSLCQLERIDSLFCFPNFASYFHDRMLINLLSELNLGSQHRMVQVYASRLWHHRGGTDDGPIKHTDMVLQAHGYESHVRFLQVSRRFFIAAPFDACSCFRGKKYDQEFMSA